MVNFVSFFKKRSLRIRLKFQQKHRLQYIQRLLTNSCISRAVAQKKTQFYFLNKVAPQQQQLVCTNQYFFLTHLWQKMWSSTLISSSGSWFNSGALLTVFSYLQYRQKMDLLSSDAKLIPGTLQLLNSSSQRIYQLVLRASRNNWFFSLSWKGKFLKLFSSGSLTGIKTTRQKRSVDSFTNLCFVLRAYLNQKRINISKLVITIPLTQKFSRLNTGHHQIRSLNYLLRTFKQLYKVPIVWQIVLRRPHHFGGRGVKLRRK